MSELAVVNASPLICLTRAGRARQLSLILSAREALERVRQAGLYISDRICSDVLKEVGE